MKYIYIYMYERRALLYKTEEKSRLIKIIIYERTGGEKEDLFNYIGFQKLNLFQVFLDKL